VCPASLSTAILHETNTSLEGPETLKVGLGRTQTQKQFFDHVNESVNEDKLTSMMDVQIRLNFGPAIAQSLVTYSTHYSPLQLCTIKDKMLYLVGLGLADETDITVKGLEIVKRAARVYLEAYTSILLVDKEKLVRASSHAQALVLTSSSKY